MKLTAEEDRETIKRFGHIRPGPVWRRRCGLRLAGTSHRCTREAHHGGPHVAHAALRRVVAVWDGGGAARSGKEVGRRVPRALAARRRAGLIEGLRALGGRVLQRPQHYAEEIILLVFVLGMVGFVLDWALRILGAR